MLTLDNAYASMTLRLSNHASHLVGTTLEGEIAFAIKQLF